ncbi:sulfate adenylyltransferase subunit CysN [Alsobacter soli]|uniref:Sulfate adenylyltransferase subunit 1 n=1 Tax=Alsobacter soli TaxID=2109933 RepID=A0A2T1HUD8_9HYPH|nr:sulfate adenylyltransferase subunit CysN [Alsobacter soli]PSC05139.1 sulfate adenylyltransferase subunit CysN [Alsobacter soli]
MSPAVALRAVPDIPAPEPIASKGPALLRFITCGSVDDGKSTLIGRMLYEAQLVHDDLLDALARDSRKFGTQGDKLDLALLVDGLSAEREQGITIDVAYRYFATPRRSFIVADTPGHDQYTRNMATGASTADLAVILVDARKGVLPQTRRHSFIVSMLGVRHIVVAVNKMDLVGYQQAVFDGIVAQYREMAARLGFDAVTPIPISALEGENVARRSTAMPWYAGPSLFEHLETVEISASAAPGVRFRFPVQWVNRPNLDFRGFSGTVAGGVIRPGDEIAALPSGRPSRVRRIVTQGGDLDEAVAGQAVTLTLDDEIDVSRGDVIVAVGDGLTARKAFAGRLLWMSERSLGNGEEFQLRLASATAAARVSVLGAVDIHSFEPAAADGLGMNEIGLVTVALDRPVALTDYRGDRELGAFILVDRVTGDTVALGLVDAGAASLVRGADAVARRAGGTGPAAAVRRHLAEGLVAGWRAGLIEEASWRLLSGLGMAALTQAVLGDWRLTIAAGLLEALLRPALRFAHRKGWRALEQRRLARAAYDADGSGI